MAWLRLLAMVTAMVSVAALTVVDASPASRPLPARPVPSRAAAADTADALNTSMDGGAAYVGEHERRWRRVRRVLRGRPHDARRHDYPPLADDAADGGAALPAALPAPTVTEGLTVAFYGDSGMNVHAQRVFRMARAEADVVVHAGDFGYE